jgi:transcriptional regulator with GAF, ATPase, and Fis domain
MNKTIERMPAEIMEVLFGYDWPGNIRELQNFVKQTGRLADRLVRAVG